MRALTINSQRPSSRDGVATVEFAIVAPILFFVVFSAVEFSQVNMIRNTADHAAYEAARACIVPGAKISSAEAKAQAILSTAGIQTSTITITPDPITDTTAEVNARIRVPLNQNLWIVPKFFAGGVVVRNCKLARERTEN